MKTIDSTASAQNADLFARISAASRCSILFGDALFDVSNSEMTYALWCYGVDFQYSFRPVADGEWFILRNVVKQGELSKILNSQQS